MTEHILQTLSADILINLRTMEGYSMIHLASMCGYMDSIKIMHNIIEKAGR